MVKRWAGAIVRRLIANGTIEEEKAALYEFGFEQGFRTMAETLLLLATGILLRVFWQCVLLLVVFTPIRRYAGGYHAKTPMQCAVKTWILTTAALLWYRFMPAYPVAQWVVMGAVLLAILLLCPVEDEHKPLQEYEIKKYRKKAGLLFGGDFLLFAVGSIWHIIWLSRGIALAMMMLLTIVIAGSTKNRNKSLSK